jgi:hypothetical protein
MKNSNDTIGNQNRDLPTCSAVPQPTALPRAPHNYDAYKAKHGVHIRLLCKYLFADHTSTEQGQPNNTIASHCMLNKLMFEDEREDRTGSHVGILVMADRRLPSFPAALSSGPSLENEASEEDPCLS